MATANPLTLPASAVPFGTPAAIGVTFVLAPGEPGATYTLTLTDPSGAPAAAGQVTFAAGPTEQTPVVSIDPNATGAWKLTSSGGTLTPLGNNTFSLAE